MDDLAIATRILRVRLLQTTRVDISVLDEREAESTSDVNEHFGEIFCYFCKRPNGHPALLAFIRQDPEANVSHIVAFYVNTNFRIIQPTERKRFATRLQKGAWLGLEVKLGVVNAKTQTPQAFYLSILVEMAQFLLSMDLAHHFVPNRQINKQSFSSLLCFNPTIPLPSCYIDMVPHPAGRIWSIILDKCHVQDYHISAPHNIPAITDILRIFFNGHLLYGLHLKRYHVLSILVPHPSLLQTVEDEELLVKSLKMSFGSYKLSQVTAIRFYAVPETHCNSADVLSALWLCWRLPLIVVKQCDVEELFQDKSLGLESNQSSSDSTPLPGSLFHPDRVMEDISYPKLDDEPFLVDHGDTGEGANPVEMDLDIDECVGEPLYSASDAPQIDVVSSQNTIILSQATINFFVREANRIAAKVREYRHAGNGQITRSQDFPVSNAITPRDDPNNGILRSSHFLKAELDHLVRMFPVATIALGVVPLADLLRAVNEIPACQDLSFVIIPISDGSTPSLVVIDLGAQLWALIDPEQESHRNSIKFNQLSLMFKASDCRLKDFGAHQISICSQFHSDYPIMHLLIATYCFGQALTYASMLPVRLTYTEKRFRAFCYQVCRELQYVNADYNFKHNYVKENGFLKPGAFKSLPSLVPLKRCPVRTDLCLFCNSSQRKNLGSHMAMQHGQQAMEKRNRRRELEDDS